MWDLWENKHAGFDTVTAAFTNRISVAIPTYWTRADQPGAALRMESDI